MTGPMISATLLGAVVLAIALGRLQARSNGMPCVIGIPFDLIVSFSASGAALFLAGVHVHHPVANIVIASIQHLVIGASIGSTCFYLACMTTQHYTPRQQYTTGMSAYVPNAHENDECLGPLWKAKIAAGIAGRCTAIIVDEDKTEDIKEPVFFVSDATSPESARMTASSLGFDYYEHQGTVFHLEYEITSADFGENEDLSMIVPEKETSRSSTRAMSPVEVNEALEPQRQAREPSAEQERPSNEEE